MRTRRTANSVRELAAELEVLSRYQSTVEPIMLRAELTRDEYRRLRVLALERGVPVKTLAGEAIRLELARAGGKRAQEAGRRANPR